MTNQNLLENELHRWNQIIRANPNDTKSGSHTPLIYIALNSCKKKIWTIFIKGFWQADLV